jgi:uncharacterized protein YndB with AHSA1/START domain
LILLQSKEGIVASAKAKNAKAKDVKAKKTKAAAKPAAKPKAARAAGGRTIAIERFIRAKPEEVWRLWTTEEGLCRWMASRAKIDARPGGRADIVLAEDDHPTKNRIVALEPARRLELEWETTAEWAGTRVAVTLAAERGGTRLSFVQSGFGDGPAWDEWYESFDAGWAHFLARLVAVAEGGGTRTAAIAERVAAPAERVWEALGSAQGLARWFAGGGTLERRAGGRYALRAGAATIEGEVREYEPGRALAMSWAKEPCTGKDLPVPTLLTLHLTPLAAGGTYVSLCHSGFGDGPEWDEIYERHAKTWKWLLANLRTVVDFGVDQRGRTIERSLLVRAPRGKVYALFATKKGLESWFPTKAEVGAKPGDPYTLTFSGPEHAQTVRIDGRLLEAKQGERIAYLWHSGARPSAERPTLVTIDFADAPGGTRVTLVESGFGEGPEWDAHYLENSEGWAFELDKIFAVLEGIGARGRTISVEKHLAAPPEKAWEAVASAAGLSRWWVETEALDAREGGAYRMKAAGFEVRGEVREAVPGRSISLSWNFFCSSGGTLPAPTLITFALAPGAGGGTRVTLVHSGFGAGDAWDEIYDAHEHGWSLFMANLATVLDHGLDRRAGRAIERSLTIAAPPERVWQALTEPADLARWQCLRAEMDARAGGRYLWDWTGTAHAEEVTGSAVLFGEGRVLAIEPGRRLELGYHVPAFEAGKHPTLIVFELAPEGGGAATRLTLAHSGFDEDPAWDGYYRGHRECWDVDLEELASLCERGAPGVVLRCEVAIGGEAEAALDALARGLRGARREGAALVLEAATRVRARAEQVGGELRLVVTEAFRGADVEKPAAYERWKARLAAVSTAPVRCGTMFE